MKGQITRTMTVEEILSSFPHKSQKLAQALTEAGLHCVGCQAAVWETLEAGMLGHGFPENAIDALVRKLNAVLAEISDPQAVTMTKRAAAKYQEVVKEEGKAGWGLRLGLKAGGCSGFEYQLDYSQAAKTSDKVYACHGVEIHIESSIVERVLGAEIDYVDGLNGSGFKISNPNVKGSCGCGKSQSY